MPALWQSENRRQQKFNEENNIYVDGQTMPLTLQPNTHNHPREYDVNGGRNGYGLKRVNSNCNVSASSNNAATATADDDDEHFYSADDPIRCAFPSLNIYNNNNLIDLMWLEDDRLPFYAHSSWAIVF